MLWEGSAALRAADPSCTSDSGAERLAAPRGRILQGLLDRADRSRGREAGQVTVRDGGVPGAPSTSCPAVSANASGWPWHSPRRRLCCSSTSPPPNLDIAHQIDLLELFAELNRQGRTMVAVLHDLLTRPPATRRRGAAPSSPRGPRPRSSPRGSSRRSSAWRCSSSTTR